MLPVSAISDAANKLRTLFLNQIEDIDDIKRIKIGHPKETFEEMKKDLNNINLFFYNVKIDGYPSDGSSDNPFYVRLHCLITAVGAKKESSPISSGEYDLRLIGEIMRVLHEFPIIAVDDGSGTVFAQLQIVPHALDLDSLNHIWSTQPETAYRLSVAYELSLAPIPLAFPTSPSPLVGDPQLLSWGAMSRESGNELSGAFSLKPQVEYLEINTEDENWAPHICYSETITPTNRTLHYVFKVMGDFASELDIQIAAKENASVKLAWNVWRRKNDNSIVAWREDIDDIVVPQDKEIKNEPPSSDPFFPNRIDPDNIDTRRIFKAKLPNDVMEAGTKTWQAVLYAWYEWTHEQPPGSGVMVNTRVKSNSVLFYGEGA